jgi:hypothetical protein
VGVSELLQAMMNGLFQAGELVAPLNIPNTDFPIVQYADDTLLILQACPTQLTALKVVLEKFAQATGLRVNYSKSCLIPNSLLMFQRPNSSSWQIPLVAQWVIYHLHTWACLWE